MKVKYTEEHAAQVITLRQQGLSRAAIVKATGFTERFVREHMAGVEVVAKVANTDFEKAVSRVYPLSVRPQGIKDYELRNICFEVYGSKLDEEKGVYVINYSKDTIYRIKERCKALAVGTTSVPTFVMDWVCDEAPTASRVALESLALELEEAIQQKVNTFMEQFATGYDDNQTESSEAQRKQQYAARRHLLKLAITEYSPEHAAVLLARSLTLTDALDSANDAELPVMVQRASQRIVEPYTDSNNDDAFYEAVEQAEQELFKVVANTSIDNAQQNTVESTPQKATDVEEFDDLFTSLIEYNPDSLGGSNDHYQVCTSQPQQHGLSA
ncbi:hypothetical protein [Pseudomonas sp. GV047]|uniref:hypothetical protein n=1 Tax=Pseudomonas sp. GV047 TaxID=2135751 RepID=UPI000D384A89|nr:hypothetical protein [Pseudomonas sp. GV047]PUB40049.1 hypothetical protein C8K58_11435 [Pseudomonas sp. GV047]